MHRIGRTGRAGKSGRATALFVPGDEPKVGNSRYTSAAAQRVLQCLEVQREEATGGIQWLTLLGQDLESLLVQSLVK